MRALKGLVLFLVLSLTPLHVAYGKIVAVVSSVKGNAFYTHKGQTKQIKAGDHLPHNAEVFTDMGAQLSLNDYYDHIYHLSGGGHLVVFNNLIELKEGYLWVQGLKYDELHGPLRVTTANAVVESTEGESIVSFDVYTGKTQLLAIKGDFVFKNSLMEMMQLTLSEGQFSFIHNDHESGRPRKPTPIGYSSYQKITGLFDGVEPFDKAKARETVAAMKTRLSTAPATPTNSPSMELPQRAVASVKSSGLKTNAAFEAALAAKKGGHPKQQNQKAYPGPKVAPSVSHEDDGKITVLRLRDPASEKVTQDSVLNYYNSKLKELAKPKPKKRWSPAYGGKSGVPVRIFGQGHKAKSTRNPASVSKKQKQPAMISIGPGQKKVSTKKRRGSRNPASIGGMLPKIKTNAFESEMLKQYKSQMRHEQEVNELIDQLNSIDMDYKKEY